MGCGAGCQVVPMQNISWIRASPSSHLTSVTLPVLFKVAPSMDEISSQPTTKSDNTVIHFWSILVTKSSIDWNVVYSQILKCYKGKDKIGDRLCFEKVNFAQKKGNCLTYIYNGSLMPLWSRYIRVFRVSVVIDYAVILWLFSVTTESSIFCCS